MIYESVGLDQPLKQGDIFRDVPRVDLSLTELAVLEDDACRQTTWTEVIADTSKRDGLAAVLPIKPVMGVVMTQNCDAVRGEFVSLCQVELFSKVVSTPPATPKKWKDLIVQHSREHLRYFYLPEAPAFGIADRMAADLRVLLRLRRADLEAMRRNRIGRLNQVGTEHFRENLAQYFRRYPYDEWYPLTREEFEEYQKKSPEPVEPFPWQR
ncbi:MAG: hypothetical protein M5U32_00570 [Myxococcota bacterium]|nr:hypothetical protein [Myxococcota bacterium]